MNPPEFPILDAPEGYTAHGHAQTDRTLDDVILAWSILPGDVRLTMSALARGTSCREVALRLAQAMGMRTPPDPETSVVLLDGVAEAVSAQPTQGHVRFPGLVGHRSDRPDGSKAPSGSAPVAESAPTKRKQPSGVRHPTGGAL